MVRRAGPRAAQRAVFCAASWCAVEMRSVSGDKVGVSGVGISEIMPAAEAVLLQAVGAGRRAWFVIWRALAGAHGVGPGRTMMCEEKTVGRHGSGP